MTDSVPVSETAIALNSVADSVAESVPVSFTTEDDAI